MSKTAYKLNALTPTASKEAQNLFFELGYKPDFHYQFPLAPYLYAQTDGRVGFDFYDTKNSESEIASPAAYHFEHFEATEITIEQLRELVRDEPSQLDIDEAKYYGTYLDAVRYAP